MFCLSLALFAQKVDYDVYFHPITNQAEESLGYEVIESNGTKYRFRASNYWLWVYRHQENNRITNQIVYDYKVFNEKNKIILLDKKSGQNVLKIKYNTEHAWKAVFGFTGQNILAVVAWQKDKPMVMVYESSGSNWEKTIEQELPSNAGEIKSLLFDSKKNQTLFSFDNYSGILKNKPGSTPKEIKLPEKSVFASISHNGRFINMKKSEDSENVSYIIDYSTMQKFVPPFVDEFESIEVKEKRIKIHFYYSQKTGAWAIFSPKNKYFFKGESIKQHFSVLPENADDIEFISEDSKLYGHVDLSQLQGMPIKDFYEKIISMNTENVEEPQRIIRTIWAWKETPMDHITYSMYSDITPLVVLGFDAFAEIIANLSAPEFDNFEKNYTKYSYVVDYINSMIKEGLKESNKYHIWFMEYYNANKNKIEAVKKMAAMRADGSFFDLSPVEKGKLALQFDKNAGSKHAIYYFTNAFNQDNNARTASFLGAAYLEYEDYAMAKKWFNRAHTALPNYPMPVWGSCMTLTQEFIKDKNARTENRAKEIIAKANEFEKMHLMGEFDTEKNDVNECKMIAKVYLTNKMALGMFLNYSKMEGYAKAKSLDKIYKFLEKKADKELKYAIGQQICYALYPLTTKLIKDKEDPNSKPYHKMIIHYLNQAIELGMANAKDYFALVLHYEDLNDSQNAYTVLNKGLKKYPKSDRLFEIKGEYETKKIENYVLNGDYEKAFAETSKLLSAGKDKEFTNDAYFFFALSYYAKKDYPNAAKFGVKFSFNDNNILFMDYFSNYKDLIKYANNPSGNAPAIVNRTKELKPYYDKLNLYLQEVKNKTRHSSDITKDMKKLIKELETLGAKTLIAMVHIGLGDIMYGYTSYIDAINCDIPGYMRPYAKYFDATKAKADDFGKEQIITKALEKYPNNETIKDGAYVYYYNSGVKAIEFFEKSMKIDNTGEANLMLGLCNYGLASDKYSGPTGNDFADSFAKSAAQPFRNKTYRYVQEAISLDPSLQNGKWAEVIQEVTSWY